MATPAAFASGHLGLAQDAAARTGWPVSLVLAQWGIESGWGTSYNYRTRHNIAGIGGRNGYTWHANLQASVDEWVALVNRSYRSVAAAARTGGVNAAAKALGNSKWAEHKYRTGASGDEYSGSAGIVGTEGQSLINTIKANKFTAYDTNTTPAPAPSTPSPTAPAPTAPAASAPSGGSGGLGISRGDIVNGALAAGGAPVWALGKAAGLIGDVGNAILGSVFDFGPVQRIVMGGLLVAGAVGVIVLGVSQSAKGPAQRVAAPIIAARVPAAAPLQGAAAR